MNKENKRQLYTSPEAEIARIDAGHIICDSPTETLFDENASWGWEDEN